MKPLLSLKILLRTPLKTILTLLLLAVASFSLFSRVAEYTVTTREFAKLAGAYRGVGTAEYAMPDSLAIKSDRYLLLDERTPDSLWESEEYAYSISNMYYKPLTYEDLEALSALPYVSKTSTRYMTAGVSEDGYVRGNEVKGLYNFASRLIVEATLDSISGGWSPQRQDSETVTQQDYTLRLTNINVLAGAPDRILSEIFVELTAFSDDLIESESDRELSWSSNSYQESYFYPEISLSFVRSMRRGEKYILSLRYVPGNPISRNYPLLLADRAAQSQWPGIYSLAGKPEYYLETAEFAGLREYIALTNDDIHTFDIVYTDDMSSILRFANKESGILEGRALSEEDIANGAAVCVISKVFGQRNRVKVGDTITMRLGNALHTQNMALGAVSVLSERAPTEDRIVELEVVGIYTDLDTVRLRMNNPFWSYSINTIFVPLPLLSVDEEARAAYPVSPSEFSFIIDDAKNITSFMEEALPLIEARGLTMIFSDSGWPEVESQFGATGTLSFIAVLTLSAAMLITTALIVYLFIGRKKRDYAIMRALGVPRKSANRALLFPLAALALIAVLGGSAAAWVTSGSMTTDALNTMREAGFSPDTTVPWTVACVCILGELFVVCAFAFFGLWRLSLLSPLALLQAGAETARAKTKKAAKPAPVSNTAATALAGSADSQAMAALPKLEALPRGYGAVRHVLRLFFLRARRAKVKTLLSIMLAALLFGAVAQFAALKYTYQDLYDSYEVKTTFMGGLPLDKAMEIAESGFVKNPYYEYVSDDDSSLSALDVNGTLATVVLTTDIERFAGVPVDIEYAEGFDASALLSEETLCVLGADLMDELGIAPGDTVTIIQRQLKEYFTTYSSEDLQKAAFKKRSVVYTVVGRMSCSNEEYNKRVYVAANTLLTPLYGGRVITKLRSAEFTLADNGRAFEFTEYATTTYKMYIGRKSVFLDTTELERLKNNMELFGALFPVAAAVLLLLGGLLPGLMILQSAKEASIFRVLGTSKARTRVLMTLQQCILSILGLLLGISAAFAYNGAVVLGAIAATVILFSLLYCLSCAFLTALCSISVTRRKILELLQTKE